MSPKDLCTIGFVDKLMDSGITVLKLEGRGRSPDYVYEVTKAYREAVDSVNEGSYTKEKIEEWTKKLEGVFNRGFWHGGYYLGNKLGEWSGVYGSQAKKEKIFLGIGKHYFAKTKIGEFLMQSGEIAIGDEIIITGKNTGIVRQKVESLYVDESPVNKAKKGDVITIKVNERIRENDKLYVVEDRKEFQDVNGKLPVLKNE
tara:strand:- start:120 stop:722 length:603 start_codon:yes stop_codon:yes gene_type:complete